MLRTLTCNVFKTNGSVTDRVQQTFLPWNLECSLEDSVLRADDKIGKKTALADECKRVSFFSFAPGACLPHLQLEYWPKDPKAGFVTFFRNAHVGFAELARERPDIEFVIKPKWGDRWIREIESVLRQGGVPADLPNLTIDATLDAHELILASNVVLGFGSTLANAGSVNGFFATGGNTIAAKGLDIIHTFTASGTFAVVSGEDTVVDYLVIAAGGGAGLMGGSGAGGYRASFNSEASGGGGSSESALTLGVSSNTVTIGGGGASGSVGANSVFASITSAGGGLGGGNGNVASAGGAGGSGGGGSYSASSGGAGTSNQGFAGGAGSPASDGTAAGGAGGGASEVGAAAANGQGGAGGDGVASTISGSSVVRAGGGGGGDNHGGAAGGSGIVIIRYAV